MDTSRLHVYVEILANDNDAWVNHADIAITRVAFSKQPALNSPEPIYDIVRSFGELDQRFGDLITSPIQQLSSLTMTFLAMWSSPDGTQSTANWYWFLQDINTIAGKVFDLQGRTAKIWLSNSLVPGILWNPSTSKWVSYDGRALTMAAPTGFPPGFVEEAQLLWVGAVDSIEMTGLSLSIALAEHQAHTDIGTSVTSLVDGNTTMTPMPFGDCATVPSPCVLVGKDQLSAAAVYSDAPCASFESLAIWSDKLGQYVPVSTTTTVGNSENTAASFVSTNEQYTTKRARTEYETSWAPTADEVAALYDPAASAQSLFAVSPTGTKLPEIVGFHTDLGPMINPIAQPRMASRGWGGSAMRASGTGAGYYPSSTGLQKKVRATVMIYPTEVCEVGSTVASDPADRVMLCASGDPWLFIENARNGGPVPPGQGFIKTALTAGRSSTPHNLPHARWIFKFPDIGIDGAELVQASVKLAFSAQATRHSYVDPVDGLTKPCRSVTIGSKSQSIGTNNAGSTDYWKIALASDYANSSYLFSPAQDVTLADCQQVALDFVIPYEMDPAQFIYSHVTLYGVALRLTVDIPVSKTKFYFMGQGRSLPTAPAILGNLLPVSAPGYTVNTTAARSDIAMSGALTGSTISLRDSLRDLAVASGNAIVFSPAAKAFSAFSLSPAALAPTATITPGQIKTASNIPAFTYATPQRRYVYSALTLRYGWHSGRQDYQYSVSVTSAGIAVNNSPRPANSTAWLQVIQQLGINAKSQANALTIETKWIHSEAAALSMALNVLQWAGQPLLRGRLDCPLPDVMTIGLGTRITVNSIGMPTRLSGMPWLVTAVTTDLDNLSVKMELQEVWRQTIGTATLIRLEQAEVSMLCIDGSDGKGNAFKLTPVTLGVGAFLPTWTSSDPSVASVDSEGWVRGVSIGGATLGKDVTISCSWEGVVKSCLFTVYETMPSADAVGQGLWLCKGGCGGNTSISPNTIMVRFLCTNRIEGDLPDFSVAFQQHFLNGAATDNTLQITNGTANRLVRLYDNFVGISVTTSNGTTVNAHNKKSAAIIIGGFLATVLASYFDGVFKLNGVAYGLSNEGFESYAYAGNLMRIDFLQGTKKLVSQDYTKVKYIPQNYIRFTDQGSYVNRTVIPNIGTLGVTYNLEANNVPALWYGI